MQRRAHVRRIGGSGVTAGAPARDPAPLRLCDLVLADEKRREDRVQQDRSVRTHRPFAGLRIGVVSRARRVERLRAEVDPRGGDQDEDDPVVLRERLRVAGARRSTRRDVQELPQPRSRVPSEREQAHLWPDDEPSVARTLRGVCDGRDRTLPGLCTVAQRALFQRGHLHEPLLHERDEAVVAELGIAEHRRDVAE
jgi:hypothetical protein